MTDEIKRKIGYGYTPLAVRVTVAAMKNNDYRGILPVTLDV